MRRKTGNGSIGKTRVSWRAAQFSYAANSYCATSTAGVTLGAGAVAGTFAATPGGLRLNPATGTIDLGLSQPGTYTVTNSAAAAGECLATTATTTVTLLAAPSAAGTRVGYTSAILVTMKLSPFFHKFALTAHITFSVG